MCACWSMGNLVCWQGGMLAGWLGRLALQVDFAGWLGWLALQVELEGWIGRLDWQIGLFYDIIPWLILLHIITYRRVQTGIKSFKINNKISKFLNFQLKNPCYDLIWAQCYKTF
jgi:hypothetical protein